jgi:hypothetical protein
MAVNFRNNWFTRNFVYTKDKGGNHNYFEEKDSWFGYKSNLEIAQNHPILTPALQFVSQLFSQARFTIVNKRTGVVTKSHWLIDLLDNPNYYQTRQDFLESHKFMGKAQGTTVVYLKRRRGFDSNEDIEAFYLLDYDKIDFKSNNKNGNYESKMTNRTTNTDKMLGNEEIVYDRENENLTIKIKDLLFFYDMPNMTHPNFYCTHSVLDGLKQTLINTNDSLTAKNIILKSNGKELISGAGGSTSTLPLGDEDKKNAESLFNYGYGVSNGRKRGIVTNAPITYQSLHIALRDLGLDESVKVDGNIIYTALHIPKDIISLEAKKTTYNNFKESMVSYVQNEMQSGIDSFAATFQQLLGDDEKLVGSYEHLPIMQFILIERYEGVAKRAFALKSLLDVGVPDALALEMTDFPPNTVLSKVVEGVSDAIEEAKRVDLEEREKFNKILDKLEKRIEELEIDPILN